MPKGLTKYRIVSEYFEFIIPNSSTESINTEVKIKHENFRNKPMNLYDLKDLLWIFTKFKNGIYFGIISNNQKHIIAKMNISNDISYTYLQKIYIT